MPGKILVIRGGAIGDFVLTLPAITALRSRFPEAQLEVLGDPHIVQLARVAGLVDRVQGIEARALAGFCKSNEPDHRREACVIGKKKFNHLWKEFV